MLRYLPTLVLVGFALYCVIDLVRSPDDEVRGLPRLVWLVLMVVLPVVGGVAWLVAGRPRAPRPPGSVGPRTVGSPRVLGPDDDPDFLRGLDRTDRTDRTDRSERGERTRDGDEGDGAAEEDRR